MQTASRIFLRQALSIACDSNKNTDFDLHRSSGHLWLRGMTLLTYAPVLLTQYDIFILPNLILIRLLFAEVNPRMILGPVSGSGQTCQCKLKTLKEDAQNEDMISVMEILHGDLMLRGLRSSAELLPRKVTQSNISPDTLLDLREITQGCVECAFEVAENMNSVGGVIHT